MAVFPCVSAACIRDCLVCSVVSSEISVVNEVVYCGGYWSAATDDLCDVDVAVCNVEAACSYVVVVCTDVCYTVLVGRVCVSECRWCVAFEVVLVTDGSSVCDVVG